MTAFVLSALAECKCKGAVRQEIYNELNYNLMLERRCVKTSDFLELWNIL